MRKWRQGSTLPRPLPCMCAEEMRDAGLVGVSLICLDRPRREWMNIGP